MGTFASECFFDSRDAPATTQLEALSEFEAVV